MTIREKLADWISGGALSFSRYLNEFSNDANREIAKKGDAMRSALSDIAAQETPGANATVKRMAKIAREALK